MVVTHLHTNMILHLCGDVVAGQFPDQLLEMVISYSQ